LNGSYVCQNHIKFCPPTHFKSHPPCAKACMYADRQTKMSVQRSSLLLQPFRVLGWVCDSNPFYHERQGQENFVTVSVGKNWVKYNVDRKLRAVLVGPAGARVLSAVCSIRGMTFGSYKRGNSVTVWKRTEVMCSLAAHSEPVRMMYAFGPALLSISTDQQVHVWDSSKFVFGEDPVPISSFSLSSSSGREVTCVLHPPALTNKVLFGFSNGDLELWNIITGKRIHKFVTDKWINAEQGFVLSSSSSSSANDGRVRVECMANSLALNVIGVGFSNGQVVVVNVKEDKVVVKFEAAQGRRVTSMSFRSDDVPMLSTASADGSIYNWSLKDRNLHSIVQAAHEAPICSVQFLPEQPVLISSGADNALKAWIFDGSDGSARLLRERSGHAEPPSMAHFHVQDGDTTTILSASSDGSFRYQSIVREHNSGELSQGDIESKARAYSKARKELRLPPITALSTSHSKRDWPTIATAHKQRAVAHTWDLKSKSLTPIPMINPDRATAQVTSVCCSACGHFVVIGLADGRVEKFNAQSAFFRGSFPHFDERRDSEGLHRVKRRKLDLGMGVTSQNANETFIQKEQRLEKEAAARKAAEAKGRAEALRASHDSPIVGIGSDALNQVLVTLDDRGHLRFWGFRSHALLGEQLVGANCTRMLHCRESDLCAVVTDDFVVQVYNVRSQKLVRVLRGHHSHISSLCFSPDGRWLVSACMDATVRVFDLPSGKLIDWCRFDQAVTSVSFAPKSDLIVTTHVNNLGLYLWVNRAYFSDVFMPASIEEPIDIDLIHTTEQLDAHSHATEDDENKQKLGLFHPVGFAVEEKEVPAPLHQNLVTMSNLPRAQWMNLTHLDQIRARNKPKEAPEKPADAPFFLFTDAESAAQRKEDSQATGAVLGEASSRDSRVLNMGMEGMRMKSRLVELMEACSATQDPSAVITALRGMSRAQLDAEVRSLGIAMQYTVEELGLALDFFALALGTKQHFDLLQAVLNLFLTVHGADLLRNDVLLRKVKALRPAEDLWSSMSDLLQASICMVDHFANAK
jgi:U3 small nucleolar RNA-associated protein 21